MFRNSVFKPNVNTVAWVKNSTLRAIKTMAQTALSLITVGQAIPDIKWGMVLSVSIVAGVYSILTSVAGIPEVTGDKQ